MPKQDTSAPLLGLGDTTTLEVQKSRPVCALWRSDLTLEEYKILDTYLARINSHTPRRKYVVFEKGELEDLLGVERIKETDLKKRLKHLGQPLEIQDLSSKTPKFTLLWLFDKADVELGRDGLWRVKLAASKDAMPYFFNIESLGYLRYSLRCVMALTSSYSYLAYMYLRLNEHKGSWTVPLDELQTVLGYKAKKSKRLENGEKIQDYAQNFKYFNRDILKMAQSELAEKMNYHFTYEPVRRSRAVVAIRFTVSIAAPLPPKPDKAQLPGQTSLFDDDDATTERDFFAAACIPMGGTEPEFTPEEIDLLLSIIRLVPEDMLPPDPTTGTDDIAFRRFYLLAQKYKQMSTYRPRKRFLYLKKSLDTEVEKALSARV